MTTKELTSRKGWPGPRKETVQPIPSTRQKAYKALNWFHDTPKTESAMYIRFQMMPEDLLNALMTFYRCTTEMEVFSSICKWWAVQCA